MSSPIFYARDLRQQMTPEERVLWKELRNRKFKGKKFRRQHPIIYRKDGWREHFYIADFYCAAHRLVIELDGKQHEFPEEKEYDRGRDIIMHEMGMTILRIPNLDLKMNLESVLNKIEEFLLPPSPQRGEGLGMR